MDSVPVRCPCGCGAELPGMVAERERGLRAETLAAAPRHKFFRHLGPLLDSELAGTGRWLDTSQQTPLDTVRMILADGAAGGSDRLR